MRDLGRDGTVMTVKKGDSLVAPGGGFLDETPVSEVKRRGQLTVTVTLPVVAARRSIRAVAGCLAKVFAGSVELHAQASAE